MPHASATNEPYDVAIIGAGVVGCAMARRFILDGARVVVLKKAAEEQESRPDASTEAATLAELRRKGIEMIPSLADYEVTTVCAGLRPATAFQDYQISQTEARNYITVGGVRSTGLSAALGTARHVAGLNARADFSGAPVCPPPDRLSNYHPRDWEAPNHGGIICHCELVSKREILAALNPAIGEANE